MQSQVSSLQRVTEFVLNSSADDIPESTLQQARLLLLDTLGICAAAAPMEAGIKGRDIATRLYGTSDSSVSVPMLFDGRSVSVAGALYAAANQTDNLDGHDGYNPTKGHIGVVAAPALAILAHPSPQLTGRDALAALVVGYEVAGRAAIALHNTVTDYHTSGAWHGLGVVAMAARLRNHTADQLRQALGIAEYHGPRSQMMREIANPTMLHDGASWGALSAMSAVIAAETGFTGAPAVTVEDEAVAKYWADLADVWQTDLQYIKPYPVCRWAHASVDAARELCTTHALAPEDIASITIGSFNNAVALFPGMPATTSEAQYSLAFAVATMIKHGRIGLEHISGDGLTDSAIASLVECVQTKAEPRHEQRYPDGRWADITFRLHDGRTLTSGDVHARGGPERPFMQGDIVAKFDEFAAPVLGQARADKLRDAVLSLTEADAKFSTVVDCLFDPL